MPKALEIWESYEEAQEAIKLAKKKHPKLAARLQFLSTPGWIKKEKHRIYECPNPECSGKLHLIGTFQRHATGIALACDTCGQLYRTQ